MPTAPTYDAQRAAAAATSSVRQRTFALVALPLALPILFTVIFVPNWHQGSLREGAVLKAQVVTQLLADNASAPMQFEDKKGLAALMESAAGDRDVVFVISRNTKGETLASYGAVPAGARLNMPQGVLEVSEGESSIETAAQVKAGGAVVGSLHAGFTTERISTEARTFRFTAMGISFLILGAAAGVAFLLGRSFTRLFADLQASMLQTARSVDDVVGQLAAVSAQQTAAAGEEAAALHETNATASEVGRAASSSAQRATALTEGAGRAEQASAAGLSSVESATRGMREVRAQMGAIATGISALSERAAAIGEIASTVALLAERSNLLALNAAIEAARAGTQGRGFSVVAQEMRNLADGSNRSAAQVKAIIGEIQASIARAVTDVGEGERRVRTAEQLSEGAGQSIQNFADVTRELARVGKEIAGAASQQNASIEQMVESIANATEAGASQLETTRQVEETTRQLRSLSQELLGVVAGSGPGSSSATTRA